MTSRITAKYVREAIEGAERELRECFEVVFSVSHGKAGETTGDDIIRFQPKLLRIVLALEANYRGIKSEQSRLIAKKAKLKQTWFKRRMARLAEYAKAFREVLAIARAIGDGFAWFWYERDQELLDEHLTHQRQPFLPPGVGGLGEQLTIERLQGFDQKLLLYHGLTSFLRMGDISFIDLKTARVAYLAELKSKRTSANEILVEMNLVIKSGTPAPDLPLSKERPSAEIPVPDRLRVRRERQIKAIGDAIVRAHSGGTNKKLGVNGRFHFEELDELVTRTHSKDLEFIQAGPSLVLASGQTKQSKSLADALLGSAKLPAQFGSAAPSWAMKILDRALENNSLVLGTLGCAESLPLAVTDLPFIWWPLKQETIRRILFREVIVMTMHNPAHFWHALRKRGFDLLKDQASRYRSARKIENGRLHELANFGHFERMTPQGLVALNTVLEMIDQLLEQTARLSVQGNAQIQFKSRVSRKPDRNS